MMEFSGKCLCGAVTVTARTSKPGLRACHCEMCRKLTSSMFMSVNVDQESLRIDGPVREYVSSKWAVRGFCETCGSILYYGTQADGARHPAAGLFPDAADAPLKLEFFTDNCPQSYALGGDHKKLTTEQTIDLFTGTGDS